MPVIDTPLGRIGAVICWENYMPLMRAAMYATGVELYCAPTVDDRDMWQVTVRHIAREGRCFVLSACQFLRRSDCPEDYPVEMADDEVLIGGGSCIVSPSGDLLAGPDRDGPSVLLADLDLEDIPRNTFDFDVVGHYARPDIFQLHVDERPKPPVISQQ
jgi:nitrilase